LKTPLLKKGIPFWGKKVYLFGVKTYTFIREKKNQQKMKTTMTLMLMLLVATGRVKTRQKPSPQEGL